MRSEPSVIADLAIDRGERTKRDGPTHRQAGAEALPEQSSRRAKYIDAARHVWAGAKDDQAVADDSETHRRLGDIWDCVLALAFMHDPEASTDRRLCGRDQASVQGYKRLVIVREDKVTEAENVQVCHESFVHAHSMAARTAMLRAVSVARDAPGNFSSDRLQAISPDLETLRQRLDERRRS